MPVNEKGIIVPQAAAPRAPAPQDAMKEIFAMLNQVEAARHAGSAELCALIIRIRDAGFDIMIDEAIPEGRACVTMSTSMMLDLQNGMKVQPARALRLGKLFEPAVKIIIDSMMPPKTGESQQ